jgi:hypothetical protein
MRTPKASYTSVDTFAPVLSNASIGDRKRSLTIYLAADPLSLFIRSPSPQKYRAVTAGEERGNFIRPLVVPDIVRF